MLSFPLAICDIYILKRLVLLYHMDKIVLLHTLVNCYFVFWETKIMAFGDLTRKKILTMSKKTTTTPLSFVHLNMCYNTSRHISFCENNLLSFFSVFYDRLRYIKILKRIFVQTLIWIRQHQTKKWLGMFCRQEMWKGFQREDVKASNLIWLAVT